MVFVPKKTFQYNKREYPLVASTISWNKEFSVYLEIRMYLKAASIKYSFVQV